MAITERPYRAPSYMSRAIIATLLILAGVTAYVALFLPQDTIYQYNTFLIYGIVALALNLLMGTAGQVSLGTAGFLAAGAFTAVFFYRAGVWFPFDVILAAIVGAVIGLIVGVPSLRLRGIYLALGTLAAYETIIWAANDYQTAKTGPAGFIILPLFTSAGLVRQQEYWAVVLFALLAVAMIIFARISMSRAGRAWRMIRDHEAAAPALGIRATRYKLQAFIISSAVTSACGALLLHFTGSATVDSFTLDLTVAFIAMIFVGGIDSVIGAVIGAGIITALQQLVPRLLASVTSNGSTVGGNLAVIIYGALVVILVTRSPGGVAGWLRELGALIAQRCTGLGIWRRWSDATMTRSLQSRGREGHPSPRPDVQETLGGDSLPETAQGRMAPAANQEKSPG